MPHDPHDLVDEDQAEVLSGRKRRQQQLANWRVANRQHLSKYGRNWKLQHPDRVKLHRQNEYAQRRRKRRRLRLRREAQRRRRALQRQARAKQYGALLGD